MKNQILYKLNVNREYLGLPVAAIVAILLSVILIICISCNDDSKSSEDPDTAKNANAAQTEEIPYVKVDQLPEFPGGEAELLKYIATNTVYPQTALDKNIQGRVLVKFCISSRGEVNQVTILQGVSPELDTEAIKVVSGLPKFAPGRIGDKPVAVWYMLPISFALK